MTSHTFRLGYGTNSFANHRLEDALRVIADLGYRAVGLTLDHHHLDPFARDVAVRVERVAGLLSKLDLCCVVETGARYLLDPYRKHYPTLLCDEPATRIDFLHRAIRIGADLDADCVSFWSGVRPPAVDDGTAWQRLRDGVSAVLEEAERRNVRLGFEPEPGMLVEHLEQALALRRELGGPELLGITLDIGHCVAIEPVDAARCVRTAGELLVNVQLDDMRSGVHEHLEFGEGELDLAGTLAALDDVGYTGVAAVELPRHSHAAPAVARRAIRALRSALPHRTATSDSVSASAGATEPTVDHPWLVDAERDVRSDPTAIRTSFPAVGRELGRSTLRPETDPSGLVYGTVDDLARTRLLSVLAESVPPKALAAEVADLYRYGDDAERRGVLRGLTALPESTLETGLEIVRDALRTNDIRLVAAAMGRFAARHLDQHSWRHGVLKCLFVGVPLAAVAELDRRSDAELVRMIDDYAAERRAAGRLLPEDAQRLLESRSGKGGST